MKLLKDWTTHKNNENHVKIRCLHMAVAMSKVFGLDIKSTKNCTFKIAFTENLFIIFRFIFVFGTFHRNKNSISIINWMQNIDTSKSCFGLFPKYELDRVVLKNFSKIVWHPLEEIPFIYSSLYCCFFYLARNCVEIL